MIEITEQAETTEEIIATRVALVEEKASEDTVANILIDLEDWKSEFTGEQLKGFLAAIEVIKANY